MNITAQHQESLWKKWLFSWKNGVSFAVILFSFFLFTPSVFAAVGLNRVIPFQGKVVNKTDGTNVNDGTYSFTFKIYDAGSSGNLLWSETQSSVSVTSGIFSVNLGSSTAFNAGGYNVDFKQNNLYLDITFNGETFGSRIQLATVPQAINAEQLDGVVATQSASAFTLTGGTSTPETLTVNGNITVGSTITPTSSGGLTVQSNGANGLTLDTGGAATVSIGATANAITFGATNNPTYSFNGSGAVTFQGTSFTLGNGSTATLQTSSNAGLTLLSSGSGNITLGQNLGNGNVVIQPNAGGQAALIVNKQASSGDIFTASASGSTKFVIQNSGNVGIGTNSPSGTLDVIAGGSNTSSINIIGNASTGNAVFTIQNNNGLAANLWQFTNRLEWVFASSNRLDLSTGIGSPTVSFDPRGTVYFNTGGSVGIGTTNPLTASGLDIEKNGLGNSVFVANQSGLGDIFTASASGTTKFVITNAGNVGIGTATPTNPFELSVNSNSTSFMQFTNNSNGTSATANFQLVNDQGRTFGTAIFSSTNTTTWNGGALTLAGYARLRAGTNVNGLIITTGGAKPVIFGTNDLQRAIIDQNGNFGIGIATPIALLDVEGGTVGGNAALIVNQTGASTNDIFTASASGTTKFVIANTGLVSLVGGQTSDIDTLTATTLKIGASTQNGLTLGRAGAGTTINGSSLTLGAATGVSGALTVTSNSATSLTVGPNGSTNPVFKIDSSTGSQASGLSLAGATSNGTVALAVISSGTNTSLSINAKGSGTTTIGGSGTGGVVLTSNGGGVTVGSGSTDSSLTIKDTQTFAFTIQDQANGNHLIIDGSGVSQWFPNVTSGTYMSIADFASQTQTGATTGLSVDIFTNQTVPNSANGNQVGLSLAVKDGGTSATSKGLYLSGTTDYGIDLSGVTRINTAAINIAHAGNGTAITASADAGGQALVILNKTVSTGDLFTASASGTTRFVIKNNGRIGIGGNIDPNDTTQFASYFTIAGNAPDAQYGNSFKISGNLTSSTNPQNGMRILPAVSLGSNSTQTYTGAVITIAYNDSVNRLAGSGAMLLGTEQSAYWGPSGNATLDSGIGGLFKVTNDTSNTSTINNVVGLVVEGALKGGSCGASNCTFGNIIGMSLADERTLSANATNLLIDSHANQYVTPSGLYSIYNNSTANNFFNGKLGIGTTSMGNTTLVVNQTNSQGLGNIFAASASGTTKFIINNSGNVGIGTINPSGLLHMASSSTGGTQFKIENNDTGGHVWKLISTGSTNSVGAGGFTISDETQNTTNFYITPFGNVGLNATTLGNAGLVINQTGNQGAGDVLSASSSGTPVFRVTSTGGVLFQGDVIAASGSGRVGTGSTAMTNAIGDQGSMIPNSGFEANFTGTTFADGWFVRASSSATITRDTTASAKGTASMKITTNGANQVGVVYSTCIPLAGQGNYTLSYYQKGSVANIGTLRAYIDQYTSKANCQSDNTPIITAPAGTTALTNAFASTGIATPFYTGANNGWSTTTTWGRVHFFFAAVTNGAVVNIDGVRLIESVNTVGVDYAENYPADPANLARPGQVVTLQSTPTGDFVVIPATKPMDSSVLGVVSTQPGEVLDDGSMPGEKVAVALSGRIPVNVSTKNGSIHMGDYLTSSTIPGVAVKATQAGQVIGIAMKDYTEPDTNKIGQVTMFIKNTFYAGINDTGLTGVGAGFTTLVTPTTSPNDQFGTTTATDSAVLLPKDLSLNSLSVLGLATVSADFRVKGNTLIEGILSVIDDIKANNIIVTGIADFFNDVVFHNNVSVEGMVTFNKDTAGTAIIKTNASEVNVSFSKDYPSKPVITASVAINNTNAASPSATAQDALQSTILNGGYTYIITNITTKGFTIKLNKPAGVDIPFSWQALLIDNQATVESGESPQSLSPSPVASPSSAILAP